MEIISMLRVENMVKLLNSHFSKITLQDEGIYLLMYLKKCFGDLTRNVFL